MPNNPLADREEVEQCDREAAADRLQGGRSAISVYEDHTIQSVRDGKLDAHPWVQAFARHRLAERERCAGIAEQYPSSEYADIPIIRGIATAIRSANR